MKRVLPVLFCILISFIFVRETKGEYKEIDILLHKTFPRGAEDNRSYSPPLKEAIEIAGVVKLTAYMELNVPDTDLAMFLYEIKPDGKSILLTFLDLMRARYRNSRSRPELVIPGTINKYVFNKSLFFARKVEKGSRFRLIISCLNYPYFEKNYNSGGTVAEETGKDARTAVIKLYHNKKYPSVLELPIYMSKRR